MSGHSWGTELNIVMRTLEGYCGMCFALNSGCRGRHVLGKECSRALSVSWIEYAMGWIVFKKELRYHPSDETSYYLVSTNPIFTRVGGSLVQE